MTVSATDLEKAHEILSAQGSFVGPEGRESMVLTNGTTWLR